jgi:hypothetical protein
MTNTAPTTLAIQAESQSTFINTQSYYTCDQRDRQKLAANIIKPTQTRIHRKKYVNGSENLEEHVRKKTGTTLFQA